MLIVIGIIDVNDGDVEKLKFVVVKMVVVFWVEEGCILYVFY